MQTINCQNFNESFPIAIVTSRFNEEVTSLLYDGAIERLKEHQFDMDLVTSVSVPGAVEIPITIQSLLETEKFSAIIALGAVVRGQTSHYDYVCDQVSQGCQELALAYNIPVIFGVLTTENVEQAKERSGGTKGHKGQYCVDAAIEMVGVLHEIA